MSKDPHDSVTKDQPGDPKNVGKSSERRGENVAQDHGKEPGRYDVKGKGDTGRTAGKSTPRDQTGVDPKQPKT